jgi:hypothetical protein
MPSVRRQPRLVHTISDDGPPTLKRIEAGRPVSRADRNNEALMLNRACKCAGWPGERTSKDKYAKFGASNRLDKSYDFRIGRGGKDEKDSDPEKRKERKMIMEVVEGAKTIREAMIRKLLLPQFRNWNLISLTTRISLTSKIVSLALLETSYHNLTNKESDQVPFEWRNRCFSKSGRA